MEKVIAGVSLSVISLSCYYFHHKIKHFEKSEKVEKHITTTRVFSNQADLFLSLDVDDVKVIETMMIVDRKNYIDGDVNPYVDHGLPIGSGQVNIKPSLVAISLELVFESLSTDAVVLVVGCGTGYISSCFAAYLSENGRVYGVDHIESLVEKAKVNALGLEEHVGDKIIYIAGDVFELDLVSMGPFDCIYVCGSIEKIPNVLLDNTKEGGILIIPIGRENFFQHLTYVRKVNGQLSEQEICPISLNPLISPVLAESDDQWKFYNGADSGGDDIGCYQDLSISELKEKCVELGGIAFNSRGWIKHTLRPKEEWSTSKSFYTNHGLYVLKSILPETIPN